MSRKTIQGLENYFGPIPTAFKINSPYGADNYHIQPWWSLILSKYQRDNLTQVLNTIQDSTSVFKVFNTGDWVSELLYMLSKPVLDGTRVIAKHKLDEEDMPNATREFINDSFIDYLATKIMHVDNISYEEALEKAQRYVHA